MNEKKMTVALFFTFCTILLSMPICSCTPAENTVVQSGPSGTTVSNNPWETIAVTGYRVNLRSGPGTQYSVEGQVFRGDSLQVTGGLDEWYRVYVPHLSLFAWIYGPLTTGADLP